MRITVGTFNLNNLFSRFNFEGTIDAIMEGETGLSSTVTYKFTDHKSYRIRNYAGRIVQGKSPEERLLIANRIKAMNLDVLAVQEVEDIDTLNQFVREDLGGMYPYRVLIEGNDPRLIDLGLLSKLPLGAIISWQEAVHPAEPSRSVFGRDLLEIVVLNADRTRRLFTLYNNHLKSNFIPHFVEDVEAARRINNERRQRQAEVIAWIIQARMRSHSRYVVLGDMNDRPDSQWLAPLVSSPHLGLVNAVASPTETRPAKEDDPPPATTAWTYRFKESGEPARYELYDQIWLSSALAERQTGAWIDRRSKHAGDGSDHDPAWVELELE
jgi:endonuclease/exonuclease/phosphatase family metal-dependent hydrolase